MKTLLSTRFKDCSYTEILDGFSSERKFRIHSQPEVLLRVSNRNRLDRIQYEFNMMKQFQKTGVPMSEPIEQVRYMQELAQQAALQYTNYQNIIPNWYTKKKPTT